MAAAAAPEGLGTEEVQASPFPAPPFWFKLYGPQPEGAPAPPPPPPPRQGTFQVFEKPFSLDEPQVPTEPNDMIAREPDGSIDIKGQLVSLSSELLPLFLELVRALVDSPSAHTEQLAAVNAALAAMQHLTNMLRPQQAAATLEHMLRQDVESQQATLARLRAQVEGLDRLLLQAADDLVEAGVDEGAAAPHAMEDG